MWKHHENPERDDKVKRLCELHACVASKLAFDVGLCFVNSPLAHQRGRQVATLHPERDCDSGTVS